MSSLQPREAVLDCSTAQDDVSGAWFEFFMQVCCLERLPLAIEGVSPGPGLAGDVGNPGRDVAEQHGKKKNRSCPFF